jgi:hypothetical protein
VRVAELLLKLVADPTAQRLAGVISVKVAKPSLPVGFGVITICQEAAYAGVTPTTTGTIMATATMSARRENHFSSCMAGSSWVIRYGPSPPCRGL